MNPRIAAAALVLASMSWLSGIAAPARADNKKLSQAYTYTVGDDIADRMGGLFNVVAGLEASTLVYYDRKAQNIVTYVVGSAEDVAGAKRELEAFVSAVRDYVVPYAKGAHGFDMTDKDVTLVYYNDGGDSSPFEVVRRENGVYKVPPPSSEDNKE
ncbi:MAG: hypothetical protein ACRENN_09985 [Candidatus Eiseniibacteriota bacterium]